VVKFWNFENLLFS